MARRDLAQRFAVIGHVGHDDEHVAALFEGEIFGRSQREARRQQALGRGFAREIEEHHGVARARRNSCMVRRKVSAVSWAMPMPTKTMAKAAAPSLRSRAFCAISLAS